MTKQLSLRNKHWTLEDALGLLDSAPHDPCLQYIAMALAQREGRLSEVSEQLRARTMSFRGRPDRRADLFSIFGGNAAVEESLQLDAMVADPFSFDNAESHRAPCPQKPVLLSSLEGPTIASHPWKEMLAGRGPTVSRVSRIVPEDLFLVESRSARSLIEALTAAASCQDYMLHQSQQSTPRLSIIERLQKQLLLDGSQQDLLLEAALSEVGIAGSDLYFTEGTDISVIVITKEPVADALLRECNQYAARTAAAISGSGSGSGSESFQHAGVECLSIESHDRKISCFASNPIEGVHLRSNSRSAHMKIIDAITSDGTATSTLGSSDEFAFARTLMPWKKCAAEESHYRGSDERDPEHRDSQRLVADNVDPQPTEEDEDLFIYLSDAFIRNLVGPTARLTERRRRICHNNLKMIEYATLLYCAQEGRVPDSIETLKRSGYFLDHETAQSLDHSLDRCPDGGTYEFRRTAADHSHIDTKLEKGANQSNLGKAIPLPYCSHHGQSGLMTPCSEIPVTSVSQTEADLYKTFLEDYNRYWRAYFDPIGISISIKDNCYRAQTVVLPLIDNSIYTALAAALGGEPEPLEKISKHKETIFSTSLRLNKDLLLPLVEGLLKTWTGGLADGQVDDLAGALTTFVREGLGNQVSFHACDAPPTFSLDLPQMLGAAVAAASASSGRQPNLGLSLPIAALAASLQLPIYLAIDVQDEETVDAFLFNLNCLLTRKTPLSTMFLLGSDCCLLDRPDGRQIVLFTNGLGPVKFRLFVERIANAVYAATQPQTLDAIWASSIETGAEKEGALESDGNPRRRSELQAATTTTTTTAHALVSLTPANWRQTLAGAIVSWCENSRLACHSNFGPLTAHARAIYGLSAADDSDLPADQIRSDRIQSDRIQSDRIKPGDLHSAQIALTGNRSCPEHGIYSFDRQLGSISCSVHGNAQNPRQPGLTNNADAGALIPPLEIENARATLTFIEDGLKAELRLERRAPREEKKSH